MKVYLFELGVNYGSTNTISVSLSREEAECIMGLYVEAEAKLHNSQQSFTYERMYNWDVIEMEIPEINIH